MKSNSHKTAITRNKLSRPARLFSRYMAGSILDFGCGKGTDAALLGADKFDKHFFPIKPTKKYDNVMLIYVLNTTFYPESVLKMTLEYVKPGGQILVACRRAREVDRSAEKGSWKPHKYGGWTTSKQTYQRGYSSARLESLIKGTVVVAGDSAFSYVVIRRE